MKNADPVKIHPNPKFVIPANPGSESGAGAGIQVKETGPGLLSRSHPAPGFRRIENCFRTIKKNSGFTVIELFVTMTLILIVAGTAMVLTGNPNRSRAAAETEALKANLRFTQSKAMCDLPGNIWSLNITASNYTIQQNGHNPNPDVDLPGSNSRTYTLPSGLTITAGIGQMRFNFRGQPVDAGGNPLAANSTITMSGATPITVNQQTGFIL